MILFLAGKEWLINICCLSKNKFRKYIHQILEYQCDPLFQVAISAIGHGEVFRRAAHTVGH